MDKRDRVFAALDTFRMELPSWGFANTGTRFGKFIQAAAATSLEEKFADAAEVAQEYEVEAKIAESDVMHFVSEMKAVGLVEVPAFAAMAMSAD